jgi:hypothetical protein
MQKPTLLALLVFASLLLSTVHAATRVYKCGTTYSQFPCPGGETIKADDIRSRTQKTQSDRAIASDKKIADTMAKNRLKQEKRDIAANTPRAVAQASQSKSKETTVQSRKRKTSKPDWFIAQVPADKKNPHGEKEVR